MVKVQVFTESDEYTSRGRVIYSPQYLFSQWDQSDVNNIVSIHTMSDTSGTCKQILVFYE